MLKIDLENCTGCGTCLEVCPVEAISLLSGKAVIDYELCNSCLECAQVCPAEAIFPIDLPLPAEVVPSRSISPHRASPPALTPSQEMTPWLGMMLSLVGRELLPRVADTLILALERRLERPTQSMPNRYLSEMQACADRRRRRRRRAGRNNKSTQDLTCSDMKEKVIKQDLLSERRSYTWQKIKKKTPASNRLQDRYLKKSKVRNLE